ncbi:glycosyltransferase family 4 protein [Micromonospora sp. WMMA1363]|uniref:glycosyltransferase family 4 protein n=1 Tax=Micromonospora sp. WMMA1363 TaxID=3053985 RepID=UPI00259D226E|nr:glycosyltransferase family 4 protein [Micromonospora sp. WMMA1363]MDM4718748.1 glycosyltransferase family 4 protein [Micromonospora sp. WMMA1363]
MQLDGVAAAGGGRVVMLVDNGVDGDSRVQKAARSAADAGWDVTLLGCADVEREWRLGGAQVRVLPMGGNRGGGRTGLRQRLVARGGPLLRAARLARRPVEHAQVFFWRTVAGDRAWRHLEPGLWTYERVFGPVVDALAPDLIHAHDFRMLGVAARAVDRARTAGREVRLVWDAHEWLPGARPRRDNVRWLPAHLAYLREYVSHADAVVTVSEALAELLQDEHGLAERPTVLLNAPAVTDPSPTPAEVPDLRDRCGVGPETPLLVYSGTLVEQRGVATVVEALPRLPGAHLALVVADPSAPYVRRLLAVAARLGVAERVHPVPYVPHGQVSAFLSAADVGLIPIHHWPNHEIALITKFFEYAHARLPVVVSDVRTMADTVQATGQGEVFRAGDATDLVRAVRAVLADPQRYRRVYDGPASPLPDWTWEAQAERLDAVYRRLLGGGDPPGRSTTTPAVVQAP